MRRPAVRSAAIMSWVLLALAVTAGPASAHTSLKAASPAIGSTVSPPSRIVLTFVDPVGFPQVVLSDAAGGRHESGKAQAVDNTVTEQVSGPLSSGIYTVGWRVVATDGHPVSGQYRFIVAGGTSAVPGAGPVAGPDGSASSRTATPGTGSSGTGWWWAGLGALLLAGLAAGIVFARRTLRPDGRA